MHTACSFLETSFLARFLVEVTSHYHLTSHNWHDEVDRERVLALTGVFPGQCVS